MSLPDEFKSYKLPIVKEDSRHFFSMFSAENWDFLNYYNETHANINKEKQFNKIMQDYILALNWIAELTETPQAIKHYALTLIEEKKPSKAEVKANLAKKAAKKRKLIRQNIIVNGDISGSNNIIGNEVHVKEHGIKRDKGKRKYEDENKVQSDESDRETAQIKTKPSVWLDWLKFLRHHKSTFHPFSPEANNIIRSGKGVSPRPQLDRDLYNRHLEGHCVQSHAIPEIFHQYINGFINSDNLKETKKTLRAMSKDIDSNESEEEVNDVELLEGVLIASFNLYSSHIDKYKYEDAFNQLLIWPYLDVIAKKIAVADCKSDFESGQPHLTSMTQQLKCNGILVDDKSCYKSDGLIKLFGIKQLELLLLETSGHFDNSDKVKLNFDHHKGVFGTLAMLKTIADEFHLASIEKFSEIKVFFLHAAETQLHLWSVCFHHPEGIFDLWREISLDIKPDFDDRGEFTPHLVQFCWSTKCLLEKSVQSIVDLREDHKIKLANYRFALNPPPTLQRMVNPVIMKLTKHIDSSDMSSLGPIYSPPHH